MYFNANSCIDSACILSCRTPPVAVVSFERGLLGRQGWCTWGRRKSKQDGCAGGVVRGAEDRRKQAARMKGGEHADKLVVQKRRSGAGSVRGGSTIHGAQCGVGGTTGERMVCGADCAVVCSCEQARGSWASRGAWQERIVLEHEQANAEHHKSGSAAGQAGTMRADEAPRACGRAGQMSTRGGSTIGRGERVQGCGCSGMHRAAGSGSGTSTRHARRVRRDANTRHKCVRLRIKASVRASAAGASAGEQECCGEIYYMWTTHSMSFGVDGTASDRKHIPAGRIVEELRAWGGGKRGQEQERGKLGSAEEAEIWACYGLVYGGGCLRTGGWQSQRAVVAGGKRKSHLSQFDGAQELPKRLPDAPHHPGQVPRNFAKHPWATAHFFREDSESESNSDSEDSIDVRKIKQEAEDWEYAPLEYLDELTQPVPGLPVLEDDDVDREIMHTTAPQISLPGPLVKPASTLTVVAGPSTAPAHAVESQLTPASDPHANYTSVAPTAVVGADTIEDLPKRRRGNKRKLEKKFECVCGKEVTDSQRESSAAKCSRAGCETVWCRTLLTIGQFHAECGEARKNFVYVSGQSAHIKVKQRHWLL
ncbi:hypothetical protein B0H14DRAFT_3631345 [Mycena olivaceomarginata]|nr:hypothetical protein B0H14DRAFT_3631345 [Mycena olivaceomarginata]